MLNMRIIENWSRSIRIEKLSRVDKNNNRQKDNSRCSSVEQTQIETGEAANNWNTNGLRMNANEGCTCRMWFSLE